MAHFWVSLYRQIKSFWSIIQTTIKINCTLKNKLINEHTFIIHNSAICWQISIKFCMEHHKTIVYRLCKRNPMKCIHIDLYSDSYSGFDFRGLLCGKIGLTTTKAPTSLGLKPQTKNNSVDRQVQVNCYLKSCFQMFSGLNLTSQERIGTKFQWGTKTRRGLQKLYDIL